MEWYARYEFSKGNKRLQQAREDVSKVIATPREELPPRLINQQIPILEREEAVLKMLEYCRSSEESVFGLDDLVKVARCTLNPTTGVKNIYDPVAKGKILSFLKDAPAVDLLDFSENGAKNDFLRRCNQLNAHYFSQYRALMARYNEGGDEESKDPLAEAFRDFDLQVEKSRVQKQQIGSTASFEAPKARRPLSCWVVIFIIRLQMATERGAKDVVRSASQSLRKVYHFFKDHLTPLLQDLVLTVGKESLMVYNPDPELTNLVCMFDDDDQKNKIDFQTSLTKFVTDFFQIIATKLTVGYFFRGIIRSIFQSTRVVLPFKFFFPFELQKLYFSHYGYVKFTRNSSEMVFSLFVIGKIALKLFARILMKAHGEDPDLRYFSWCIISMIEYTLTSYVDGTYTNSVDPSEYRPSDQLFNFSPKPPSRIDVKFSQTYEKKDAKIFIDSFPNTFLQNMLSEDKFKELINEVDKAFDRLGEIFGETDVVFQ